MPLFGRRKELSALKAREEAGESLWTSDFSDSTLGRIVHAMDDFRGQYGTPYVLARQQIMRERGVFRLSNTSLQDPRADLVQYMRQEGSDAVATAIEAYLQALGSHEYGQEAFWRTGEDEFAEAINAILRQDRISFELVHGEMVPFSSRELHVEVVAPTLRLIAAPGWERVETAYQQALKQIADGNPPNAITDAGTALQEALEMLGATGNALGPLIKSARSKGILAGHDQPLADSIRQAAEWVSADRSNSGDAHKSSESGAEDAWLIVHIVGALLLRLSGAKRRA